MLKFGRSGQALLPEIMRYAFHDRQVPIEYLRTYPGEPVSLLDVHAGIWKHVAIRRAGRGLREFLLKQVHEFVRFHNDTPLLPPDLPLAAFPHLGCGRIRLIEHLALRRTSDAPRIYALTWHEALQIRGIGLQRAVEIALQAERLAMRARVASLAHHAERLRRLESMDCVRNVRLRNQRVGHLPRLPFPPTVGDILQMIACGHLPTTLITDVERLTMGNASNPPRSADVVHELREMLAWACRGKAHPGRVEAILRMRFGWSTGQPPATLNRVAKKFGVSRERVRQLQDGALSRLRGCGRQVPALVEALDYLGTVAPVPAQDVGAILMERGLTSGAIDAEALLAAARVFGLKHNLELIALPVRLRREHDPPRMLAMRRTKSSLVACLLAAGKATSELGPCTERAIHDYLPDRQRYRVSPLDIRNILQKMPFVRHTRIGGFMYFYGHPLRRNGILRQVLRKLFSISATTTISAIHAAIQRHLQYERGLDAAPASVIGEALRDHSDVVVRANRVTWCGEPLRTDDVLDPEELACLQMFRRERVSTMESDEIFLRLLQAGIPAGIIERVLFGSPVVKQPCPDLYAPITEEVTATAIRAAEMRARSVAAAAWTGFLETRGRFVACYRITPVLRRTGAVELPPAEHPLGEQPWKLLDNRRRPVEIPVETTDGGSRLRGLQALVLGSGAAPYLTLTLFRDRAQIIASFSQKPTLDNRAGESSGLAHQEHGGAWVLIERYEQHALFALRITPYMIANSLIPANQAVRNVMGRWTYDLLLGQETTPIPGERRVRMGRIAVCGLSAAIRELGLIAGDVVGVEFSSAHRTVRVWTEANGIRASAGKR